MLLRVSFSVLCWYIYSLLHRRRVAMLFLSFVSTKSHQKLRPTSLNLQGVWRMKGPIANCYKFNNYSDFQTKFELTISLNNQWCPISKQVILFGKSWSKAIFLKEIYWHRYSTLKDIETCFIGWAEHTKKAISVLNKWHKNSIGFHIVKKGHFFAMTVFVKKIWAFFQRL